MPHLDANGIRLHHRLDGPDDAPTVMLSNSLGTSLDMWHPQIQALTQRYRVLRYDSRGHGESDVPAGPYTVEMLAGDAIGLLDALGIEQVHFCGISKGGMVGQMLGARHGDRLKSLTLVSTACHMPPPETWQERIRTVEAHGMKALVDAVLERWFTEPFRREPSVAVDNIGAMIRATPSAGYAACCAAIRDMDLRDLISNIAVPTQIIVGADDPATPPAKAEEIAVRIPGAQVEVVPGAAHLLNLEQDVAFDAALLAFLDRNR